MQDGCRIFGSGKYGKMAKKYQHHKLPSCLGYPKHEGKDEENLTHFFGHYLFSHTGIRVESIKVIPVHSPINPSLRKSNKGIATRGIRSTKRV